MVAFKLLEEFSGILDSRGVPIFKDGSLGTYEPNRDWSRMSNQERFQQDNILMNEFLTEITIVIRCFAKYPVYDEFIRGVQELDRTREIPMYLAFAAQILLDIHHILRGGVYSAQEKCMSHLGLMDEDLALHQDFDPNIRIKKSVPHIDQAVEELRRSIKVHLPIYQLHDTHSIYI